MYSIPRITSKAYPNHGIYNNYKWFNKVIATNGKLKKKGKSNQIYPFDDVNSNLTTAQNFHKNA